MFTDNFCAEFSYGTVPQFSSFESYHCIIMIGEREREREL